MNEAPVNVLLLEDSPSDATLLREALAQNDSGRFRVTHVETLAEGLAQLQEASFDVLLLDLSLPDSTSRETFVRARAAAPRLPIVVLSGMADEAVALEALRHGIQDYLVKGQADGTQTARAIRYAIERNRVEAALKETEAALRESERQLREWNQELERRVASRTAQLEETVSNLADFSHSVTHDLRAPLRAMRAFAQFLGEECAPCARPAAQDYVQRIIKAAARMDQLIVDVLHYSHTARSEVQLGPVDVSGLVRGIIESYPAFHSPPVEVQLDEPLPRVLANAAVLTQCFSNLLGNAVKFVAPGVAPRIRIWAELREVQIPLPAAKSLPSSEGQTDATAVPLHAPHPSPLGPHPPSPVTCHSSPAQTVRFWVEDNGIGIPKQAHQRIFRLFERLDNHSEGTGVGLAIVRKGVEKMGGQAGVESEPGRGSRFWLELKAAGKLES